MPFKDFRLLLVVSCATIVFIISLNWVLGNKSKPRFHEIEWDSRSITHEIVDSLRKDSTLIEGYVRNVVLPFETPKRQNMDSALPPFRTANLRAMLGLDQKVSGLNDSLWELYAKTRLFLIDDSLQIDSLDIEKEMKTYTDNRAYQPYLKNVAVAFRDTSLPLKQKVYKTKLPVIVYDYSDEFMSKYPIFGVWALLIIIQLTLFVIFIFSLLYLLLFKQTADENILSIKTSVPVRLVYILIISFCLGLYYWFLIEGDGDVLVKKQYFMAGINDVFAAVNISGYFTAGLCIAGLMFSFMEINKALDKKLGTEAVVEYLDEKFKIYFLIAAIILSLAVFTTGTFFSALNSLDFIKQRTIALGYSPVPKDFVYLYGLVHTFLLLVFYVPTKLKLDKLRSKMVPPPPAQNWTQMKKLGELAVASSPLLAGMLQSLIDMLNG